VTDTEIKIDDEAAPELIATHFLSSVDDVVEHLRAANVLGFGVRLHSVLSLDGDSGGYVDGWELELLTTSPVQENDEQEELESDEV
jgi:hypothetical protein